MYRGSKITIIILFLIIISRRQRIGRQHTLNNVTTLTFISAGIPVSKEPAGLYCPGLMTRS